MFKSDNPPPSEAQKKRSVIPVVVMVALVPTLSSIFVSGQPREVMVARYSVFLAALAAIGTVILQRRGRRGAALVAAFICLLFTALFVGYAYLAYKL